MTELALLARNPDVSARSYVIIAVVLIVYVAVMMFVRRNRRK